MIVADVSFEQDSYVADEEAGMVTVCMVISGLEAPTMSGLWVDISTTTDGDATGMEGPSTNN